MLLEEYFYLFVRQDEFVIECPNVGEINRILIGHDNKGFSSAWFLDRILVEDVSVNRKYEFPCNRWLAKDEDDEQISRFLVPKSLTNVQREPPAAGKWTFKVRNKRRICSPIFSLFINDLIYDNSFWQSSQFVGDCFSGYMRRKRW